MSKVYSEMELDLVTKGYIASIEKLKQANAKLKTDYERKIAAMNKKNDVLMSSFKKMAGIAAAAFSTQRIIAFGKEAMQLSATMEGVSNAFNRLDDPTLLSNLRKATHGTVSDLKLMSTAVQAKNLGIPIEHLATLFGFAASRARDTGESVDYLINSMALGLGRQSTLRLDNVGLSVKALNDRIALTGDFFKGAFSVIKEEIDKAGGYIETAADSMDRWKASVENFKASFGKSGVTSWAAKEMDEGAKMIDILGSKYFSFWQKLSFVFRNNWEALDKIREIQEDILEKAKETPGGYNPLLNGGIGSKLGIGQGWSMLGGAQSTAGDSIKTIGDLKNELKELESEVDSLSITDTKAVAAHLRKIEAIKKQIDALTKLNKAVERTLLDPEQLWNSLVKPTETGQQLGGTWGALEGSFADPSKLAQMQGAMVKVEESLANQYQVAGMLQDTFGSLFSAGIDGWDDFGQAAVNAIKQMLVQLAALAATYAVLSMIPGFAGFMEAVGGFSGFMRSGMGFTAGTMGSSSPVAGGMELKVKGTSLATATNRGTNIIWKNT